MKKIVFRLCAAMLAVTMSTAFVACGNDDDDEPDGGLKGWYTDLSSVAKQSDFNIVNEAINNKELLSSYRYGGQTHNYIASYDLFIDSDGCYTDWEASYGRLRFAIPTSINAIRIVDSKTLIYYSALLYIDGSNKEDVVYRLYAGPVFGNMAYYGKGSYYTYARVDNKIIVSDGDIYTISDGGLIKDGSSAKWSKYDPSRRY